MPRVPQCILMRLPPHMLHSNVLNRPRWLSSTRYGSEVTTQLIPRYQMDKNDPQTQPTVNLHSCSEDDFPPLFQIESVALHCMAWQDSSRSRSPALGFTALDRPHIDWFSKMDPGSPVSPLVQPTGDKLCCQYPHPAQPSPAKPSPAQLSREWNFSDDFPLPSAGWSWQPRMS